VPDDFRCSTASRLHGEPMGGTAPTERALLFVEYAGAWGRDAPILLSEHVVVPAGIRAQLIRRHRATTSGGLTVFAAWSDGDRFTVETTRLRSLLELADLDLVALAGGRSPGLTPHDDLLWLVCTNGRRDLCCAEIGRPVTAALAEAWPDQTWETTHLGGHRFASTLLALPSGITLGRLDPVTAVLGCRMVADGLHPVSASRGRAGVPGAVQAAELHLLAELEEPGSLEQVRVDGDRTEVTFDRGRVVVQTTTGPPRRQSCADLKTKPAPEYEVVSWARTSGRPAG
jgi:hypothetical protein